MPDVLNKQSIINLLIDSPLREPIKINLIDIVNNTNEPDLPKVFSTITKELEIFQKATERRMKLAEETIAKLGGVTKDVPAATMPEPDLPSPAIAPTPASLDLPPLPAAPAAPAPMPEPVAPSPLSVPPLDLPPMPQASAPVAPSPTPAPAPAFAPLGGSASSSSDEDALAEIQKELDSLKSATATEISSAAAPVAPTK